MFVIKVICDLYFETEWNYEKLPYRCLNLGTEAQTLKLKQKQYQNIRQFHTCFISFNQLFTTLKLNQE